MLGAFDAARALRGFGNLLFCGAVLLKNVSKFLPSERLVVHLAGLVPPFDGALAEDQLADALNSDSAIGPLDFDRFAQLQLDLRHVKFTILVTEF